MYLYEPDGQSGGQRNSRRWLSGHRTFELFAIPAICKASYLQIMKKKYMYKPSRKVKLALSASGIVAALSIFLIIVWPDVTWSNRTPSDIGSYRIVPEYLRTMRRVLISIPIDRPSIALHREYLQNLPKYTEIFIIIPEDSVEAVTEELERTPYFERTTLVPFSTTLHKVPRVYFVFPERDKLMELKDEKAAQGMRFPRGTLWAQDLFEVGTTDDGRTLALISGVHKWFVTEDDENPLDVASDNFYVERLSSVGITTKRLPLTFAGGNVLVDEFRGRKLAFVGGDVFRKTRTVWKSIRGKNPSDDDIADMLKQFLGVDEVIAIGRDSVQPALMFHLDQAMIPLGDGRIGVTRVAAAANGGVRDGGVRDDGEIEEVEIFLAELRQRLSMLGYRLIDIDTSPTNVRNHQYYANGIPYRDAETNQKTLMMPVFPTTETRVERALVRKNREAFESIGYKVIEVPSRAERLNGGLHCLINVLE